MWEKSLSYQIKEYKNPEHLSNNYALNYYFSIIQQNIFDQMIKFSFKLMTVEED